MLSAQFVEIKARANIMEFLLAKVAKAFSSEAFDAT